MEVSECFTASYHNQRCDKPLQSWKNLW